MENELVLPLNLSGAVVGFWTTAKKYIPCKKTRLNLTRLEGGY